MQLLMMLFVFIQTSGFRRISRLSSYIAHDDFFKQDSSTGGCCLFLSKLYGSKLAQFMSLARLHNCTTWFTSCGSNTVRLAHARIFSSYEIHKRLHQKTTLIYWSMIFCHFATVLTKPNCYHSENGSSSKVITN